MTEKETKTAIDRAYPFCKEQQMLLDDGRITESEWFENHRRHFTEHYLACDNPRGQSGHGGDEERYHYTQSMVLSAINRSGTFIDIGCANGYMMEKLSVWLGSTEYQIEFFGLDISSELVSLAKQRLPLWKARFYVGNALYWVPPQEFDFVCVRELGYAPTAKRKGLLENLYENVAAHGGRLIIGPITELRAAASLIEEINSWGYPESGRVEKPHQEHTELIRRVFWIDKKD